MSIRDATRARKTYSFYRAAPIVEEFLRQAYALIRSGTLSGYSDLPKRSTLSFGAEFAVVDSPTSSSTNVSINSITGSKINGAVSGNAEGVSLQRAYLNGASGTIAWTTSKGGLIVKDGDAGIAGTSSMFAVTRYDGGVNYINVTSGSGVSMSVDAVSSSQRNGLMLIVSMSATSSVQQYSPLFSLVGNGYNTASLLSRTAEMAMQTRPIAGSPVTGELVFWKSMEGEAHQEIAKISSDGTLTLSSASNLLTTIAPRLLLENTSSATVSNQTQNSPALMFVGQGWNDNGARSEKGVYGLHVNTYMDGDGESNADLVFSAGDTTTLTTGSEILRYDRYNSRWIYKNNLHLTTPLSHPSIYGADGTGLTLTSISTQASQVINGSNNTPGAAFGVSCVTMSSLAHNIEYNSFYVNQNHQVQFSGSNQLSINRTARFNRATYTATTSSFITSSATLAIDGPPLSGTNMTITDPYAVWAMSGTSRFDGPIASSVGTAITGASAIAPTTLITHVTGTVSTTIATITPPAGFNNAGGCLILIPDAAWSTNTSGNIALATSASVGRALWMTYDNVQAKWYPSY